jgi:hypothetical protein
MLKAFALGVLMLGAVAGAAAPQVTIYLGGFGHVVEPRSVYLAQGGDLVLDDLPLTMLLDSFLLHGLTMTRVDPVPRRLPTLEGLVGTSVTVFARGERFEGRLVGVTGGLALVTADGMVFLPAFDRIVTPLPPDLALADRLALRVRYRDARPGWTTIGVQYLAEGLSWRVTYAAALDGASLRLTGLATLENRTGVEFMDAEVWLVAGEVYRPTARDVPGLGVRLMAAAPELDVAPAFEYHRYAFPTRVDVTEGVALVPLLSGDLAYSRAYRFAGGPVEVRVRFKNTVGPLPAGEVRVYDAEMFVGAASIGHTPVGNDVDLAIGAAFDLTGERVHDARQRITEDLYRDTYRITLRSAKDAPVEVEVVETLPGTWTITQSSLPYERLDAQRILFRVRVPAGGTAEVRYTVEWRY